ncbi:MAG: DinB family protein [Planctomycetota bacterium]|nr:DinB family protein [Planctomycetota bacterium]
MNERALIARLAAFPAALRAGVGIVSLEDARFKPAPQHWSILEICCHLLDEEREDFRARVRSTLEDPARPWADLSHDQIAERRGYNQRELAPVLDAFERERAESVAWLASVAAPRWENTYRHPTFGPLRAGDLMASWAAHDALHLRQIAKRIYNLAERDAPGFKLAYAGDWTA